ncbi:cupin domain-containing protein [Mycobacterium sp. NPDC003449]
MAKIVTESDRHWRTDAEGYDECDLWNGADTYSELIRMDVGYSFEKHIHRSDVRIFVVAGVIELNVNGKSNLLKANDFYVVEAGDQHTETAVEDKTVILVNAGESRDSLFPLNFV